MSTNAQALLILAAHACATSAIVAKPAANPLPAPAEFEIAALRSAIEDISAACGERYSNAADYLGRLDRIERGLDASGRDDVSGLGGELAALRREALTANPLVSGRPILFVVRNQYKPDHHNTATMFKTGEINTNSFQGGGALKTIDLAKDGQVTVLLELKDGVIRDPDVHFSGRSVVFSMRRDIDDDYHICRINADGTGLTQLTYARGVADFDPLYLPDESIVFSSTREPKYCMCNRHIMGNLFKMDADGANIHQIGKSTLHEGHGALMPDGRILYDRWEYVDRNFGDAQGLWTVNPDGTCHAVYWGNNTNSPGAVLDARVIPGTQQVLCNFSSCHDRPWGVLAIIDRRLGLDGRGPVVRTWPANAVERVGKGNFDAFTGVRPKYEDPYPLSERYFLCSRMTGRGEQMGIYLIDLFGNEILLHVEGPGCFDPMPLGPRPRPPVVPSRRDFRNSSGRFYVVNVYEGTHMEGVRHGAVKYLRVVESPEKRSWTHPAWSGQGVHCPAMNWHAFENKRILGTVPVEEDGSAYFEVPADRFVYFQLLDANKMMVQSMRSGTIVQSGELTGCTGCHDNRRAAPPQLRTKMPMAMMRAPSQMSGGGEARLFSYIDEVQPVFDRHCVSCHDYGKEAGETLLLARDRTNTFNTSYNELWRKKYIKPIGAGPHEIQQAYSWGSHESRLIGILLDGHEEVKLSKEELQTIAAWIDINGPYYPFYESAYPDNLAGRSPLDDNQLRRLTELTGVQFARLAGHSANAGPQISFDRPELSPCIQKLKDSNDVRYVEALAIIQAGGRMLHERPRADMAGFVPCPLDRRRLEMYAARQQAESRNRRAIRRGGKLYETPARPTDRADVSFPD
ncbi:MAG: hypothetical protein JSU94_13915 [Phycisphaerales bacterium]|nr:MAG: hypothetical protein JSU94_13915 [Phycisphaerales bacterium]